MKTTVAVIAGVVGAVLGFIGALVLLELVGFAIPAGPILTGLMALLVFAPLGAIAGLLLGVKVALHIGGETRAGNLRRQSLKVFAVSGLGVLIAGGGYLAYSLATATPWL